MQKLVLTGAGGMLGTEILNLVKNDMNFTVATITSQTEKLSHIYSEFSNIEVFNINELPEDKMNGSIFINCSFPRNNDTHKLSNIIDYTVNLLQLFVKNDGDLFINISSQSVYKQSGDTFQNEKDEVSPANQYGLTKYAIEKLVESYCVNNGMSFVNLRLGSLAGINFDQRMINRFIKMIMNGESIHIDQGDPKVSYLSIMDAAVAILKLVKNKKPSRNLYNLANNDYMSVYDLVSFCDTLVRKETDSSDLITFTSDISNYNNVINSNLFYDEFNWHPQYNMKELSTFIYEHKKD